MEKYEKFGSLSSKKADAAADIELINRYSRKELKPEDVYCFSVILCDNDVDRDYERFTDSALEGLAGLFVGKTGILDHRWTAQGQVARLYRVEVEKTGRKNRLGGELKVLRGSAYMLKTESTQDLIAAIDGGIVKEVSVGCSMKTETCSICGKPFRWGACEDRHKKGQEYDGKLCVGELGDPRDAYEFSFVAVPTQPGAGVTKSMKSLEEAFALLETADLSGYEERVKALLPRLQMTMKSAEEREELAKILKENEKFLKKEEKKG